MCRALAHRGPDDELVLSGPNWALGQRRLSIIDLSQNGRQPFVNEDGTRFLTSNGEIYNYRDLRPSLLKAGHHFVSGSDCEVILHLLEQEGDRGILKLNGMYAFAYLDEKRRKLLLCRDRLGIKPLYYRRTPDTLAFASEIKALVSTPVSLQREHLQEFFQYRYLSGSNTLFKDVVEILPGHLITINLDTLAIEDREYWTPAKRLSSGAPVDERDLARELEQAVSRQLVSDVPLGCQLSGGLDSSLVTQLAMRQMNQRLHTFSVGFNGHAEDESSWAAMISQELGTLHHSIHYQESDFLSDFAACTWLNDEPLNHPNSVAMFKMCQEAKHHVTVLMTGEGADELFGGYTWHKRLWRLRRLGRMAQWPLTRQMVGCLPKARWAPMLPLLGISPREMAMVAGQWVSSEALQMLLCNDFMSATDDYRCSLDISDDDPVAASLDLDLRTYLVSVLQRQDRMSMASGVESRVPFLDHELVDFALTIPVGQLFEGLRGKAILRHVAAGRIPDAIITRPKLGFSIPLACWMRQGKTLGGLLDWLYDERAAARRIWKIDPMRQLVTDHRSGKTDNSIALWSFLSFEVWSRIWLDGTSHERLKEEMREKTVGSGPSSGRVKHLEGETCRAGEASKTKHQCEALGGRTLREPSYVPGSDKPRPPKEGRQYIGHEPRTEGNVGGALRGTPELCRRAATGSTGDLGVTVAAGDCASHIEEKAPIEAPSLKSNVYSTPFVVLAKEGLRSDVSSLKPLRVCHIVTSLRIGGMERMVCDLMGGLQARGIQSVLCCTDEKGELYDGAPAVAKFCGHRESGFLVIDWKLACQIRRFARDNHVNVLHAHNHAPHLYAALLSFFTGLPVVATRHGQGYHDKFRVKFLKRFLAGKTSPMVLVSEDAQKVSVENHSLSADDVTTVIPNGIDTARFVPLGIKLRDHSPETESNVGEAVPNVGEAVPNVG
ncbi:MAG: asparagine synthase (glutamine-hydrolyzing), partial [bacterium]